MNVNSLKRPFTKALHLLFIAALAAGLALSAAPVPLVRAAAFTVDSTADAVDANPGDGVCATIDEICSLRAAIQEANTQPGDNTVTLPAGTYQLAIIGAEEDFAATGDLDIATNLIITGAGAGSTIIDGGGLDRVFDIGALVTVDISDLTIQNGNAGAQLGGGIRNSSAALTLTNVILSGNSANFGGAIFNNVRPLALTNVTITGNTATPGDGGGIENFGSLTITNSTISSNRAGSDGGGIRFAGSAVMTLNNVAISNNTAGTFGGGIGGAGAFSLTLAGVTISGNTASTHGGGVFLSGGTTTMTNVTISGNTVTSFAGGGLLNAGTTVLTNVTITGNSAPPGNGGGIFNQSDSLQLKNTIVADNPSGENCAGSAILSLGHNLDSGIICGFASPGDITNANPLLGPLANNGGPTLTHALLVGSPAIDAGSDCPPPVTDQRGVARPQGAACDIGAFELEAPTMIQVPLDIKPGSDSNSINPKSKGTILVAILSTAAFNASSQVDKSSVTFGRTGDEQSLAFCNNSSDDVNGDGLLDLVCHFYTQLTGFQTSDTEGVLRGKTLDSVPIEGRDSVRIVPPK